MRWTPAPKPIIGTSRTRSVFALLPVGLETGEMAWLERIVLRERLVHGTYWGVAWEVYERHPKEAMAGPGFVRL